MIRPKKLVVDCSTGVSVELDMTDAEIAQAEANALAFAEAESQRTAAENAVTALKASAKAKLIAGQPLTEEEAEVLVL